MFAIALWDRARRAARARPRPARQEAAPLRAASGRLARVRLGDEGAPAAAAASARARPAAARRLPRAPVRPALGAEGGREGAARIARRRRGRRRFGSSATGGRGRPSGTAAEGDWVERVRERGDGGRAAAARRRRAARRAPLRRARLLDRRRGDGGRVGRAGAHVHGRLRRRALRRAGACARRRRALRDATRGARDRPRARAPRPASPRPSTSRSATRRRCRCCSSARRRAAT